MVVTNIRMTGAGSFRATSSDVVAGSVATHAQTGTEAETLGEAAKRHGQLPSGVELVGYHPKRDGVTHSLKQDEDGSTLVLATRASAAKTGDSSRGRQVSPADLQAAQDKFWNRPRVQPKAT